MKLSRTHLVAIILLFHAGLLAWMAWVNSPVENEVAHLPAGLSHWEYANFDLYRVNPPLVRMLAAAPLLLIQPRTDWAGVDANPYARSEFRVGCRFAEINGRGSFWYFTLARWACIPLSLLGGWVCYRWAQELYGEPCGLVALLLWAFSPSVLGWGATMMPDLGAASLGVAAGYVFWRWLRTPTWGQTLLAGVVLGAAELTKTTWILLFLLWPLLWLVYARPTGKGEPGAPGDATRSRLLRPLVILVLAVSVINFGYGFERVGTPLGRFAFISEALGGKGAHHSVGNRFQSSPLGSLPVPLPENYVRGIDVQKHDFEIGKWSYLRGEHRRGGWFHYYAYGLAVKSPVGTLALLALALLALARSEYRSPWRDELVLLAPAVAVFLLVSSQTGFNQHVRYLLPAIPFLNIAISRVGRSFALRHRVAGVATVLLLLLSIAGSLSIFPHSLSYFNELVGGPTRGHAHLLGSSIDWGQDLLHLKCWLDDHPEARPIHVEVCGAIDPAVAGIDALPAAPCPPAYGGSEAKEACGPMPGWFAVSVNHLHGYRHYVDTPRFAYLLELTPTATAGYSIYVYDVSPEDANRVRGGLGLPSPGP